MKITALLVFVMLACVACAQEPTSPSSECDGIRDGFAVHLQEVLSDTTGRFSVDYPKPIALTCELLQGLEVAMKDDSVRYHFERLHQRYSDPRPSAAFSYIQRHNDFHLAIALTTHWNADVRVDAVKAVGEYRRIRQMVCAPRDHHALLENQDHQAVGYFILVLENTPWVIAGSENSTIHGIYISWILCTLDLFTGTTLFPEDKSRLGVDNTHAAIRDALMKWKTFAPE